LGCGKPWCSNLPRRSAAATSWISSRFRSSCWVRGRHGAQTCRPGQRPPPRELVAVPCVCSPRPAAAELTHRHRARMRDLRVQALPMARTSRFDSPRRNPGRVCAPRPLPTWRQVRAPCLPEQRQQPLKRIGTKWKSRTRFQTARQTYFSKPWSIPDCFSLQLLAIHRALER
jgi:hypothetical protein